MAWYKIADGPLDIVGKTLKVVTSLSDTPIICSEWNQGEDGQGLLIVRNDEPRIRERIYVLDNFPGDWSLVTNGTFPLTGIFVSENIRSISIAESEEVHQIEPKYLPTAPSVVFIDNDGFKSFGYAHYLIYQPEEANVSISDGSEIVYVNCVLLHSTSENTSDMGHLEFDNATGKVMVHPGAERDVTTVCAIFMVTKDPGDFEHAVSVSAIVTIEAQGSM